MAQLDKLIFILVDERAEAIHLADGEPAVLNGGATPRQLTRKLSPDHLTTILREIASPAAIRALDADEPVKWRYTSEYGVCRVTLAGKAGQRTVQITILGAQEAERPTSETGLVAAPAVTDMRGRMEELLRTLVKRGGSDLHLRCGEPPILRLNGEMHRLQEFPTLTPELIHGLIDAIIPDRNRSELESTSDTDFAYEIEGVARFRANALRDRLGPAAVFRVIPATVVSVEQLGLSRPIQNLCYLSKGLVLVTGPTGSGKSTTLCALIDLVNRARQDHIITIEDPIEFVHPNKNCIVTQRQVGVHTTSFKTALRAALREDPDIILVGELRDLETVSIAIETAETGHLVFGTLHTTTAPSTVDRIIDQFPSDRQSQVRVMLADSLKGVIAQTLLRRKDGAGRVAAMEVMLGVPAISNLIREGKTFQIPSVLQTSRKLGMITLNDALLDLVDRQLVEAREAYVKAVDKTALVAMLRAKGHDTSFLDADPTAPTAKPESPRPSTAAATRPGAAAAGAR